MIQYAGSLGDTELPDFGLESTDAVTAQGTAVINADGTVVPTTPVRQVLPG
ncbi:hypothetical protein G3I15_40690 [Streptomyces sp. SID10244]|nr:hypothetical protein [Streptomyces sp. SID10244]